MSILCKAVIPCVPSTCKPLLGSPERSEVRALMSCQRKPVLHTYSDQMVGVHSLKIGCHLLNPAQHVSVAANSVAAGLVDKVPC